MVLKNIGLKHSELKASISANMMQGENSNPISPTFKMSNEQSYTL